MDGMDNSFRVPRGICFGAGHAIYSDALDLRYEAISMGAWMLGYMAGWAGEGGDIVHSNALLIRRQPPYTHHAAKVIDKPVHARLVFWSSVGPRLLMALRDRAFFSIGFWCAMWNGELVRLDEGVGLLTHGGGRPISIDDCAAGGFVSKLSRPHPPAR